jgi:hypothetical protein
MRGFIRLVLSLFLMLGIATAFAEILLALGWLVALAAPPENAPQTSELLESMTGLLEQVHLLLQTSPAFVLTAIACSYLVPALTAMVRGRQSAAGILVFNLFLGWTVLGWVLALVWAVTGESGRHAHTLIPSRATKESEADYKRATAPPLTDEQKWARQKSNVLVVLIALAIPATFIALGMPSPRGYFP